MSSDEHAMVGVLTERINHLIERLDKFEEISADCFVTRAEFTPVQRVVYGGIGVVLTGVVVSVLSLVVLRGHGL